jgi:hypothetical protein
LYHEYLHWFVNNKVQSNSFAQSRSETVKEPEQTAAFGKGQTGWADKIEEAAKSELEAKDSDS